MYEGAARQISAVILVLNEAKTVELNQDLPETEREQLVTAFRESLLKAMQHGAGFDSEKVVEVSAIRSTNNLIIFVSRPGARLQIGGFTTGRDFKPADESAAHILKRRNRGCGQRVLGF